MPNINNIASKRWSVLSISRTLQGLFQEGPITAFKRKWNLKELTWSKCIEDGKVKRAKNTLTTGKRSSKHFPCLSKTDNLCCRQLTSITTFISQQTKRKFKIYHKVKCKSEYVIYLMECTLCNKQYIGKAETAFNQGLYIRRTDFS